MHTASVPLAFLTCEIYVLVEDTVKQSVIVIIIGEAEWNKETDTIAIKEKRGTSRLAFSGKLGGPLSLE